MLFPFPLLQMTWRESIVGFQSTEMVYMQVERNWVFGGAPGFRGYGSGQALGKNLGSVKWRMREEVRNGKPYRVLHSEAYELQVGTQQTEDLWVSVKTNAIAFQEERRTTLAGTERAESTFHADRVETTRAERDGRTVRTTIVSEGGMAAVQRRFEPVRETAKEFLLADGIKRRFVKVRVEPAGRFRSNWGTDRFEGKDETAMLTPEGELIHLDFSKEFSLALMGQPKSKRFEERRKADTSP